MTNSGRQESTAADAEAAMLSVSIDRQSSVPLVRQLYLDLRDLILSGRLAAGARLPSTRQLAADLKVSRTVPLEAYAQLTADGFLEGRQGAGHFAQALNIPHPQPDSDVRTNEPTVVAQRKLPRPFDPSWQAADLFPKREWGRALATGWRKHQASAILGDWYGMRELRQALAGHLYALRGVALSPEQIVITAGISDALQLIFRTFRPKHRSASCWIENPCLIRSFKALEREGIRATPIPVDSDGACISEGIIRDPHAEFALLTPARQFPLGMRLSLARRLELLGWAQASNAIIIEDDYDSEVRFSGRPLQSLGTLGVDARVLTLGTISKLTFPGLRIGYIAGSEDIIRSIALTREAEGVMVSTNGQAGLTEFIDCGSFARHLRVLRSYLAQRQTLVAKLLPQACHGLLEILPAELGSHVAATLHPSVGKSDLEIAAMGATKGLVLFPLSQQYISGVPREGFFLGHVGWSEGEIVSAINELGSLLETAASRNWS